MKKMYTKFNIFKNFILWICFISIITACQKDIIDDFQAFEENWENLDDFFNSINTTKRVLINDSSKEFVISTKTSTLLFGANSFIDENNYPITGEVIIEYIEILNSGNVLLNNINTKTFDKELLHSTSMYHFDIIQNGKKLKIAPGKFIEIFIEPEDKILDTEFTYEWIVENGISGWFPTFSLDVSEKNWNFSVDGQTYIGSGLKMKVWNTGWFCMGSYESELFPSASDYGKLKVEIPNDFLPDHTRVFVAYVGTTVLMEIPFENKSFSSNNILKNAEVEVIVISVLNNKLHEGSKHIIFGDINEMNITPQETDYLRLVTNLQNI